MTSHTRTEYRAFVKMPNGFTFPTDYRETKKSVVDSTMELANWQITHAQVERWEKRTVLVGEWEEAG